MPRKTNSFNSSNYHYLVKKYSSSTKDEIIETKYFRTQTDISNNYGLKRSSIYFVMNPDEKRLSRKWREYEIEKLSPPIPVYEKVEKEYI
jgi:hypothetical protein